MVLESLGGEVAEEFHAAAPFDQSLSLGREAFEFDGLHFAAVLFPLHPALCLLVVVEIAFHPAGGPVEEICGPPEQFFEIGLKAGVTERRHKGVEDVGDGGGDDIAVGQRPWIGFVLERAPAVEMEFGEGVIGLGGGVDRLGPCIFGIKRHRLHPSSGDRAHRGLRRRRSARAGRVGSPRPLREGLDGRGWTILTFAMQRRLAAGGK